MASKLIALIGLLVVVSASYASESRDVDLGKLENYLFRFESKYGCPAFIDIAGPAVPAAPCLTRAYYDVEKETVFLTFIPTRQDFLNIESAVNEGDDSIRSIFEEQITAQMWRLGIDRKDRNSAANSQFPRMYTVAVSNLSNSRDGQRIVDFVRENSVISLYYFDEQNYARIAVDTNGDVFFDVSKLPVRMDKLLNDDQYKIDVDTERH